MGCSIVLVVLVQSLAPELVAADIRDIAKDVELPKRADKFWEYDGIYSLEGQGKTIELKLYHSDSVSLVDKKWGVSQHPNTLKIHALYREGRGQWKYRELYLGGRVGFDGNISVKRDSITFEVGSRAMISMSMWNQMSEADRKRIETPVTKIIELKNDVPSLVSNWKAL